jgi:hypothetical protein
VIWDLRGTPAQNQLVLDALDVCDFPFDHLRPSLLTEGRQLIAVEWADLSRYSAVTKSAGEHSHVHDQHGVAHPVERVVDGRLAVLGLFYLPPHTRVVLDSSLQAQPRLAMEVFLAEAAHAVDYHYMTTEHRRQIVNTLHRDNLPADASVADGAAFQLDGHTCSWFDVGPYRMWVGEAFMEAFIEAWAPSVTVTIELGHPVTPEMAQTIRRALVDPVRDVRVFRGRSRIYHDEHRTITPVEWFDSPAAAEAAGLRPCRVCKP